MNRLIIDKIIMIFGVVILCLISTNLSSIDDSLKRIVILAETQSSIANKE